jgi:hypothetical protein
MLQAFSAIDTLQKQKYGEYLDLEGVSAVAKSENLASYDRTYECQAEAICYAVQNPEKKNTFLGDSGKCISITVEDMEKEFKADFSSCKSEDSARTQRYFSRCDEFASKKIEFSRMYIERKFMTEVQLENKTLLAQKILDLRKKMTVLIEKVRAFSTHFNKIIDDVDCTSPDPSGK